MLKNRPPRLINNLKKYYPNVWEILDEIKKTHLFTCITENMDQRKKNKGYIVMKLTVILLPSL